MPLLIVLVHLLALSQYWVVSPVFWQNCRSSVCLRDLYIIIMGTSCNNGRFCKSNSLQLCCPGCTHLEWFHITYLYFPFSVNWIQIFFIPWPKLLCGISTQLNSCHAYILWLPQLLFMVGEVVPKYIICRTCLTPFEIQGTVGTSPIPLKLIGEFPLTSMELN